MSFELRTRGEFTPVETRPSKYEESSVNCCLNNLHAGSHVDQIEWISWGQSDIMYRDVNLFTNNKPAIVVCLKMGDAPKMPHQSKGN